MKKERKDMDSQGVSRRGFLGVMAGASVVGAATLTGCTSPVQDTGGTGWLPNQYRNQGNAPLQVKGRVPLDPNDVAITRDDEKCILCGQCIEACEKVQSVFGYYELPVVDSFVCVHCGQCALWCPTGAIKEKSDIERVQDAINDPNTFVVVQTAPSTRVGIGEEFGLPAGTWMQGQQVAALRALGFDKVFDTNFGADLTIMEEASELVHRITSGEGKMPQMTSCCPGWVKFMEFYYPDLLDHLSTARSPMSMQGPVTKTYYADKAKVDPKKIFNVAIMPCVAKKFEISRPEMNAAGRFLGDEEIRDMDAVLSVRELADMIRNAGLDLRDMAADEQYDSIMGEGSGAGLIFGNTGGVMEAAVRTAYHLVTNEQPPKALFQLDPIRGLEDIKVATVNIPGAGDVKVAVAHGLGNARILCEEIRAGKADYHFVEIMACPGGCISGGGQPKTAVPPADWVRTERIKTMYNKDAEYSLRTSHDNMEIKQLYNEFVGKPLGDISHQLLHTHYSSKGNSVQPKKEI